MVCDLVRNFRDQLGLSQLELGTLCGVTDVFVSYLERGQRLPRLEMGDDFYWRLATLVADHSGENRRRIYAKLVLEHLRYRHPREIELCLEEIKKERKEGNPQNVSGNT